MKLALKKRLFLLLQYTLPQHLLSRFLGAVANSEVKCIKNFLISLFIKVFKLKLDACQIKDPKAYHSFNQFFIRQLDAPYPNAHANQLLSPAEGFLSEFGSITEGQLIQAKGHQYALRALLADNEALAETYLEGHFATIYLAPFNYHRVHMPIDGILEALIYVPGALYSVNLITTQHIPNLFTKNERLIMTFKTEYGKLAVILVGAMLVAGIVNHFVPFSHQEKQSLQRRDLTELKINVARGAELGYFEFGSTVIMLIENPHFKFATTSTVLDLGNVVGIY